MSHSRALTFSVHPDDDAAQGQGAGVRPRVPAGLGGWPVSGRLFRYVELQARRHGAEKLSSLGHAWAEGGGKLPVRFGTDRHRSGH